MMYRSALNDKNRPVTVFGMHAMLLLAAILAAPVAPARTGFVVAAPDRGFVGNEETREAFSRLNERYPAELVFVTDERTQATFSDAIDALQAADVDQAVVLPLYLSPAHPDHARLEALAESGPFPIALSPVFGNSVHAVAVLADRLAALSPDAREVIVVGFDPSGDGAMRPDLERLARAAADRFDLDSLDVLMTGADRDALAEQLSTAPRGSSLVPFHLGPKHDGMMSRSARIGYSAPESVKVASGGVTPHPAVTSWLLREAARHSLSPDSSVGVIVHAHGADFNWNEAMRRAAAPLEAGYLVEYAFSMADPPTLERAVNRLVERGAQAIVLVRVFGMAESFRAGIERLIGADYERCEGHAPGHHGHRGRPAPRIVAPVPIATVGGLEDHPLFARALLDRALALSGDPRRETVIVVAHGKREDAADAEWITKLDSIRRQMRAAGGDEFRAIEIGTWREDWPDKREPAIARIRGLIENAIARGERVIVVPARTNAQGPARRLVPDLEFELAEGFAGHPLFPEWLDAQVRAGLERIDAGKASANCPAGSGTVAN